MAQQLYFSRDSKLYIEFDSKVWEIPVLDGFSFSQATNTTDIALSEMQGSDGISRRGRRLFTDSLAPAEWSFSSYVRPFYTGTEHHAVEEVLWAVMAGADKYGSVSSQGAIDAVALTADSAGDRTQGTYVVDVDDTTYSGSTGTGAVLQVSVNSSGNADSVAIVSAGVDYNASETFTVPASLVGGGTGTVVVTVSTVDAASSTAFYRNTNVDSNSDFDEAVAMPTAGSQTINFGQSNRSVLATCNLYFVMETNTNSPMVYKLSNAQINEASLDFDVDGIATINWSGFAATITDMQSAGNIYTVASSGSSGFTSADSYRAAVVAANADTVNTTDPSVGDIVLDTNDDMQFYIVTLAGASGTSNKAIGAGVDITSNFIRNRLTQCIVSTTDTATAFPSGDYNLTLTGGNVTVSNNITYLVPEELGNVNLPIEGVTGGRTVTGNFTCYLTLDTAGANRGSSVDLFNDMTTSGKGLDKVVNDFQVTFQIGGSSIGDGNPRLYITMPKVHIDVPVHSVEDVISVETGFGAYTDDFDKADEIVIAYFGDTTTANQVTYP